MNMYQEYPPHFEPFISIPIDFRLPVNPIPGGLNDSLEEHGIPKNPIPGRLYFPFPILP